MYRAILWIVVSFLFCGHLIGQDYQYQITQYTTDDGLPSNECHDLVQDSLGYVWIATDRGLCRYDGYGFRTYGINEGLKDISCLRLFLDHEQQLWIWTFSNQYFKYLPKEDTIVAFEYNNMIANELKGLNPGGDFYVSSEGTLYCGTFGIGILKILQNGSSELIRPQFLANSNYTFEIENKIFYSGFELNKSQLKYFKFENGWETGIMDLYHKSQKVHLLFDYFQKTFTHPTAHRIKGDTILICSNGHHYFFEGDHPPQIFKNVEFQDVQLRDDSTIITAGLFNQGLRLYKNYDVFKKKKPIYQDIISNVSLSRILIDKEKNIITSSLKNGIYFLKQTDIQHSISRSSFNHRITSIEQFDTSKLAYVTDNRELWIEDISTEESKNILISDNVISDIHCPRNNAQKIYVADVRKSGIYKNEKYSEIDYKNFSTHGKKWKFLSNGNLAFIWVRGFLIYDKENSQADYNSHIEDYLIKVNDIEYYKSTKYLLACLDGLFSIDIENSKRTKLDSIHPVFGNRINDIKKIDSTFYFASQGYGLVKWDGKSKIEIIDEIDGIVSNNIERLFIDLGHNIYLCTYSGLSKIPYNYPKEGAIINYTKQHGLLSNDVYDCTQLKDKIYVATSKGISIIGADPSLHKPEQPILENIIINNKKKLKNNWPTKYKHNENNISIHYKSLNLSLEGDIAYQYKLNDNQWTDSKSTYVNFALLSPGEYKFFVRAANRDGDFSAPLVYEFEISKPWWKTLWFYGLVFLVFCYCSYLFYKNRIKSIQHENKIQNELINLERSALQAQMNPHFIFNCLNSIQHFIIKNDKENAMDYLSKFAKLIRQNLNASTNSLVPLDIEISMLKNYMELEQLRMDHRFDYKINVAQDIEPATLKIPPLLIQPFVENAILHGIKSKEGDGLIALIFNTSADGKLRVTIKDNGGGLQSGFTSTHKSLGMSITQKRLSFINKNINEKYQIESESNAEGTTITIEIQSND